MEIKNVGVVGCGIMGSGIAQVCSQSGYQVIVLEVNDALLNKGLEWISSFLSKGIDKGKISERDKEAILSRIKGTTDTNELSKCELIIEAATENIESKKNIFAKLDKICPEYTILATNTSCLSIIDISMATTRPDKVLGIHFANPVPLSRCIEIVRSIATSSDSVNIAKDFCKSLGRAAFVAQDTPGFITNRLLFPYLLNAIRMVETKIAMEPDIDQLAVLGLNHPMGPLTLADFIGLDTVYYTASAMYEELKDPVYTPPILLKKMVAAGWLGRKTGKGFYEYN